MQVLDFTPEWDYTAGGSKLLLTGSVLPGARTEAHTRPLFIKFDQTEVRAAWVHADLACKRTSSCSLVVAFNAQPALLNGSAAAPVVSDTV